jgi:hypothetical protein
MNARTKTGLTMTVWLGLALMLVGAAWAQEASPIGEFCFKLLPFDDTISIDVVQMDTPVESTGFFTYSAHWQGLTVYALHGGGTATYNPRFQVFTLDIIVQNTSTFFDRQRICRLSAVTSTLLSGSWVVECLGNSPPTPAYIREGGIAHIDCAAAAEANSRPRTSSSRLVGE